MRELAEEVGLRVRAEQLLEPWQITERSPGGLNTVAIFTLPLPPLPGKLTPLHFVHFPTRGLDGAEQCVATARRSKLM